MVVSHRFIRISDAIQQTLVVVLRTKIRDPRLKWVSITDVEVSKDLRCAKVFFSMFPKTHIQEILKAFEGANGFFRKQISKKINLRIVPNLTFFYDDSLAYGDKIDRLIYQARIKDDLTRKDKETT